MKVADLRYNLDTIDKDNIKLINVICDDATELAEYLYCSSNCVDAEYEIDEDIENYDIDRVFSRYVTSLKNSIIYIDDNKIQYKDIDCLIEVAMISNNKIVDKRYAFYRKINYSGDREYAIFNRDGKLLTKFYTNDTSHVIVSDKGFVIKDENEDNLSSIKIIDFNGKTIIDIQNKLIIIDTIHKNYSEQQTDKKHRMPKRILEQLADVGLINVDTTYNIKYYDIQYTVYADSLLLDWR